VCVYYFFLKWSLELKYAGLQLDISPLESTLSYVMTFCSVWGGAYTSVSEQEGETESSRIRKLLDAISKNSRSEMA